MSTEPDLTPSEREADRNAAEARAELREAIAQVIRDTDGTHFSTGTADALIAGPLAGLQAENERLLDICKAWKHENGIIADQRDDALAERDRLRAQVEAVRELADGWCDPNSPTEMTGPQRIFGQFLQHALNAADGGATSDAEVE